jgi:two-component system sensor histidine kinase KdpD
MNFNHGLARHAAGVLTSVAAVAVVTGAIFALEPFAPVLSLGVLYVFAVLPVAVLFGLAYALPVSVASMLAFNWFFLPPKHTLQLTDSENWVALAVYLFTAVVVSGLAARARRRAAEAEQRQREAALFAEVSAALLEGKEVQSELRGIAERAATVLGATRGWIELESIRRPEPTESAYELKVGGRQVGRLFLEVEAEPPMDVLERMLPALASILVVALERERLARKALETETLRRSDAVKTAILRAVSHDLRSPLTAIRAAGEGLDHASLDLGEADRAALLDTIRVETKRLERLVVNLLDLSQLEAGAALPQPELWTIDEVVGRSLDALGPEAARVSVELSETAPVRVDAMQIERVLVNLLENALKFSSPDDAVELTVENTGNEVVIRVADRGPGLAPGELERIFEPFERLGSERGTGLGLAIARGFAEANGVRLWAESVPGEGAVFLVAMPKARTPARVGT